MIMRKVVRYGAVAVVGVAVLWFALIKTSSAQQAQIDRGKYLVTLGSCTDCHTPGFFSASPT
jgi:mono/diheme cytochrome c family protein